MCIDTCTAFLSDDGSSSYTYFRSVLLPETAQTMSGMKFYIIWGILYVLVIYIYTFSLLLSREAIVKKLLRVLQN